MFDRIINPTKSNSYFLFGARGTGKTTWLHTHFSNKNVLFIDLLDPEEEDLFSRIPSELTNRISAHQNIEWVIIDEIQKVPKLLNLVHKSIDSGKIRFILTGSSGRNLKRGVSNLLAGRAFVYRLYPLTHSELKNMFDLLEVLRWGSLPKVYSYTNSEDKAQFLRSYALTYLKEEIAAEQIIRKLDPFRYFLEVAAQSNGKIINFSKIAGDIGVDTKTVQSYYSILEDTLIGVVLPSYHTSVRKRQRMNPKFYLFDLGVKRALERSLTISLKEGTYAFEQAFEHFLILEIIRLSNYTNKDWTFSYLQTKDNAEINLIIDRPGLPTALIEIKSTKQIKERDVSILNRFAVDIKNSELFCFSRDVHEKKIDSVWCCPWNEAFEKLGLAIR
jgi:predicted AAA+ superfamily ATPase